MDLALYVLPKRTGYLRRLILTHRDFFHLQKPFPLMKSHLHFTCILILMSIVSVLFHHFNTMKFASVTVHSIPRRPTDGALQVVNISYGNFPEYLQLYYGKEGKYFVDSPSCHIAKTPLLPPYFQKPWPLFVTPRCHYEKKPLRNRRWGNKSN